MRPTRLLMELETLASKLGVQVSYEPLLAVRSGLCRLHDDYLLIIDRQLSKREQVEVFIDALKGFDLEGVHVLPLLRDIIEERRQIESPETDTPED